MTILIAMSWPSHGKPDFVRVNTTEIVTNEMNVACKPKRPTKLIFDRTWSVAGLPKSVAARGVDERRWMRFGCATRPIPNLPEARASRMCSSPETGLSLETAAKLSEVMPGAGGRSCLERYEYAKHGACFGFDPDAYFGTMVRLNQEIKESEAGKFLADNYGKTVSRRDFDAAFAKSWGKENVKAVKLTCQGNPAYLTEIQISIKADAINAPLSANSFLPQPHPGNCGKTFVIDKAGY